jgi:hypothetical protein
VNDIIARSRKLYNLPYVKQKSQERWSTCPQCMRSPTIVPRDKPFLMLSSTLRHRQAGHYVSLFNLCVALSRSFGRSTIRDFDQIHRGKEMKHCTRRSLKFGKTGFYERNVEYYFLYLDHVLQIPQPYSHKRKKKPQARFLVTQSALPYFVIL